MSKLKRVFAIIGAIALLVVMLSICGLLLFAKNFSDEILRGLISCLVAIPIVAYGYMLLCKYASKINKSTEDTEE